MQLLCTLSWLVSELFRTNKLSSSWFLSCVSPQLCVYALVRFRHTNHSVLVGKTILWNFWQSSLTRMLSEGEFTLSRRIKQHTHSSVWVRRQLFIWWLKGNSAVLIPSLWGEKTVKTFSSTPERDGRWRQGRFEQLCSDQQVADMKQIMWDVSNEATWNVLHDLIIYEKPTCTACLKGSDLKCLKVFVFSLTLSERFFENWWKICTEIIGVKLSVVVFRDNNNTEV